jgi:hypothetical protein
VKHDPASIARANYEAYVKKDQAAIEACLQPISVSRDRSITASVARPDSRSAAGQRTIRSFDLVRLAFDGTCVFVSYEGNRDDCKIGRGRAARPAPAGSRR